MNEMRFVLFVFLCYILYNCVSASGFNDDHWNDGSTSGKSRDFGPIGPSKKDKKQQEQQRRYDQAQELKQLRQDVDALRAEIDERAQLEAYILQTQFWMDYGTAKETCIQESDRQDQGFRFKCTYLSAKKKEHYFRSSELAEMYCIVSYNQAYKCAVLPLPKQLVLDGQCREIKPKQLLLKEIQRDALAKILSNKNPSAEHNQLNQPNLVIQDNQTPHHNQGDYQLWNNNYNIWSSDYNNQAINQHLEHNTNDNNQNQSPESSSSQSRNKDKKSGKYRLF